MGFLSQNADKAFKKASKRAYVPPWWKPASYLAGGVVVALVIVVGVTNRDQDPVQYASAEEVDGTEQVDTVRQEIIINPSAITPSGSTSQSVVTPSTPTSSSPAPTVPTQSASSAPASTSPGELPTSLGGTITVDPQALTLARKAALALYTGGFSGIPIYDNLQPPAITRAWPKASLESVESADDLSGQGYVFQVVVDPDSGSGPEAPREVQVIVLQSGNSWYFQPF